MTPQTKCCEKCWRIQGGKKYCADPTCSCHVKCCKNCTPTMEYGHGWSACAGTCPCHTPPTQGEKENRPVKGDSPTSSFGSPSIPQIKQEIVEWREELRLGGDYFDYEADLRNGALKRLFLLIERVEAQAVERTREEEVAKQIVSKIHPCDCPQCIDYHIEQKKLHYEAGRKDAVEQMITDASELLTNPQEDNEL